MIPLGKGYAQVIDFQLRIQLSECIGRSYQNSGRITLLEVVFMTGINVHMRLAN